MSSKRTFNERIAELKYRQEQLKEQERALLARQTVEEKKARTKRIMQTGTAIEEALGHPIRKEELEQIIRTLSEQKNCTPQTETRQPVFNRNRFPQ